MELDIYQIDAFANTLFSGNPAAIIPLEAWIDDSTMQKIAAENNLSETAFVVKSDDKYHIRWMTPKVEVDLCGHATLAAAHCLYQHLGETRKKLVFHSRSGPLLITKETVGYLMDFPVDLPRKSLNDVEKIRLLCPTSKEPHLRGKDDYLVILQSEEEIRNFKPDLPLISKLQARGLIISAPGQHCDFVSRCFYPAFGIAEDPVTGSAHTLLAPFWNQRMGKAELSAQQLSSRSGELTCRIIDDRVYLYGRAVTYLVGKIYI
ncbi:MAG: PhzF family phenazine biosynthesis protein [Saprospiraceae bacterium]|nr:PhzF family phenazine biosynthesis protein [Saprospiraceae bacterium]